ncbi:MAG: alkaline phosphatase [Bacteroidales bacterium]|jgi:alkaline phosphatase|nr:alkaline phosphatase [Bacteroidales bacterium]
MRKVPIYTALILAFILAATNIFAQYDQEKDEKLSFINEAPYKTVTVESIEGEKVKNVILMIGDGMGLTQISTAWVANRGDLNMTKMPFTGLVRTYAANKLITDSGAAGTAMATGQKTSYHSVGVDVNGNPLPSLTDLANAKGLSTAVVVTCGLTDATPAAFCANNADRDMEEELAADFLDCNVDFILGGGRDKFIKRTDGRDLMKEMEQKGYQVTRTWEETSKINSGKVFAVLEDGQLLMAEKRGEIWQHASMKAIEMLSKNDKGFFAMLEGSRIDDCGHWHDIPKLMGEIFDFDQTIGKVLQWAEKDGETLVIVLADHETGGLTLLDGSIENGTVKGHFSTGGHSDIMVPVFAYGPQAEKFVGVYENTDIFKKISEILNLLP